MQLQKETCPLDGGVCRAENVIYQATTKTDNSSKIYIGLSANQLKKRISTHNTTYKSKPNEKKTTSSTNKQLNFQN